jgi:glycosyltransferase TcdB-like subunit of Tc toxin
MSRRKHPSVHTNKLAGARARPRLACDHHANQSQIVEGSHVLTDLQSATILDFDRDGLPDVLQPWFSGPECLFGAGHTSVNAGGQIVCISRPSEHNPSGRDPVANGRPLVGYLNRGLTSSAGAGLGINLLHRCMDAGYDAATAPPFHSLLGLNMPAPNSLSPPLPAAFFTPQAGATVGGAWSMGLVMWVPDSIPGFAPRPFFAEPTSQGSFGCDIANFDSATFLASWRWRDISSNDWAKADTVRPLNVGTNWFADVDGDGLVDEIAETGDPAVGTLRRAQVYFTRRFAAPEGGLARGAIQKLFVSSVQSADSLVPAEPPTDGRFFYVDINGDGLVDLVSIASADPAPNVRPGDGRGRFECEVAKQPAWGCALNTPPANSYPIAFGIGAPTPMPFDGDTLFHDVTGDGMADIIRFNWFSGDVSLWINLDGRRFECAASGCVIGRTFDDVHSTFTVGPHRLTFADMDADGIDDLVVMARAAIFVIQTTQRTPSSFPQHAARPGLLTRIDNGSGATTKIQYRTIQELDIEAQANGDPWQYHSRAVESVVTQIETRDIAAASGGRVSSGPACRALPNLPDYVLWVSRSSVRPLDTDVRGFPESPRSRRRRSRRDRDDISVFSMPQ